MTRDRHRTDVHGSADRLAAPAAPDGAALVVCPTPIGNDDDLTLRAAAELRGADVVACEDTRRAGRLLAQLGIKRPLLSLHEHNEQQRVGAVLARLRAGERVVLVTDAGTPVVSDPGYPLIRAVADAGLPLVVLPGASAVTTAVVASGLPLDAWRFAGFLPRKDAALRAALRSGDEALVAFESPRRLRRTLAVLAELDPTRPIAVCRELTKTHEEVVRGSAAEVAAAFAEREPLGEIVLVVGPGSSADRAGSDAGAPVARLTAAGADAATAARVVRALGA